MWIVYVLLIFQFYCNCNGKLILEEPANIIIIGDWGGSKTQNITQTQRKVASQMFKYANKSEVSFVISVGDNFYPDGVTSKDDPRFRITFEEVYLWNNLTNVSWYVTLGNHDHRNNNSIHQLEYAKTSKIWNLPEYFYNYTVVVTSKNSSINRMINFIMIDTVLLCQLNDRNRQDKINSEYYNWLESVLKNSLDYDSIFVIGHHTIFSQMQRANKSNCMIKIVNPLLAKYNVDAYFSGHDHTLQYLTYTDSIYNHSMHYFVSGSGSFLNSNNKSVVKLSRNAASLYYEPSRSGFLVLTLNTNYFQCVFHTSKETIQFDIAYSKAIKQPSQNKANSYFNNYYVCLKLILLLIINIEFFL